MAARSSFFQTVVVHELKNRSVKIERLFQEERGISMLQQERNMRTQVEALVKERTSRMQQLKILLEQDQDLSDILCSLPYSISADAVPSVEQLETFQQHIQNQNEEKVWEKSFIFFLSS